ncbi:MAG: SpoIIE family protein phosphatase [Alkalispirochaeta sp.]
MTILSYATDIESIADDLWHLGPESTVEVGHAKVQKDGEHAAGDTIRMRLLPEEDRTIVVLSDGLGSGVKASVLSSLTATMALEYSASDIDPARVGGIIMRTLPVCSVRKIRYATFTACNIRASGQCDIVNFDNPGPFLVGESGWSYANLTKSEPVGDVVVNTSGDRPPTRPSFVSAGRVNVAVGQYLVTVSDGVTQAGVGSRRFPLGWGADAFGQFLADTVARLPGISAQALADMVISTARSFDAGSPKDDISCVVIYRRQPRRLLVATGPPIDPARDADIARAVDRFPGKTVLAGGTTANLVARELGRRVRVDLHNRDPEIPPVSHMDDVDLITEGTITVSRVVELLESGTRDPARINGATMLLDRLLASDEIHFIVGTKINEAHQNPSVPMELEIRRNLIKRLCTTLEERYLKHTTIRFV